jgi:aryl-alcohol dehydrogenase-like predicted oxidoreductase
MVKSGKILYAGISDAPAWVVSQANTFANLRGLTEFTGLQIEYSLIERTSGRELLPMAQALDIGVTAWSPLGNEIHTGKYNKRMENQQKNNKNEDVKEQKPSTPNVEVNEGSSNSNINTTSRLDVLKDMLPDLVNTRLTGRNILITEEVIQIAEQIGRSPAQVALNWIRQEQNISPHRKNRIIPIIGARKESQIKENIACLEFELSNEQLKRLNEISKIEMGFPYDFLNSKMINEIIYDGTVIHDYRK